MLLFFLLAVTRDFIEPGIDLELSNLDDVVGSLLTLRPNGTNHLTLCSFPLLYPPSCLDELDKDARPGSSEGGAAQK